MIKTLVILLLGRELEQFATGQEWFLSCWKNSDDPAPGGYTYSLDPTGYPHNAIWDLCIDNNPRCACLKKFAPSYIDTYTNGDWSRGCTRKKPLNFQKGDGFRKYSHIKDQTHFPPGLMRI